MKKLKLFILYMLLCLAIVSVGLFAVACTNNGNTGNPSDDPGKDDPGKDDPGKEHTHTWGEWVLEVEPTFDTVGKATRTCTENDGGKDTKEDVPKLSDSSVWTKDANKSTPATHAAGGKDVYTSVYGEVGVATDATGHVWGEWSFNPEPTLTASGKVTRSCTANDGGKDEKTVPALSDTEFWTITEHTDATHEKGEKTVYECEYGTVTVEGDPIPAPFANKTYYVGVMIDVSGNYGKAQIPTSDLHLGQSITLDKTGTGTNGTGSPFVSGYTYKFNMVSYETGEVDITKTSSDGRVAHFKAFMDLDSCIMVMAQYEADGSTGGYFKHVYIIVPAEEFNSAYDSCGASVWYIKDDYKLAITYTCGNGTADVNDDVVYNIYIEGEDGNAVYYGASFKDRNGAAVLGENAYNSDYLYVYDKDGNQLGAFGCTGSALVEVDGLEGEYDIALNDDITHANSKLFLSGFGTATLTTDEILNGTYIALSNSEYDLLIVFEEQEKAYYLTFGDNRSVTLVAVRVTVTLNLNGHGTLDETVFDVVPGIALELKEPVSDDETIVFMGWYYDADFNNAVEEPFIPVATCTLYAKWIEVPAYAGTFKGGNIHDQQGTTNWGNRTITISPKGVISGRYTGTVTDYNSETQLITWRDTNGNTRYFIFDAATGVIITKYNNAEDAYFGNDIDFYSMYAESIVHFGIRFALPEHTGISAANQNLRIVKLAVDGEGTTKTIVVYYNRIYSNVTLADLNGAEITVENVKGKSSLIARDATTGAVLLALKTTSGTLEYANTIPLDAYFGTYTDNLGKTVVLDGAGNITYDGVAGTYKVEKDEDYTISAFVGSGANLVYYEITIVGTTVTTVKPEVTVTFNLMGIVAAEGQPKAIVGNKNIPVSLPTLTDNTGAYLFDGWYLDENLLNPVNLVNGKYTPSADVTLYALWIKNLKVTVHYNNAEITFKSTWFVGDGKTLTIDVPDSNRFYDGLVFAGFYTDANCTEGYEWENGSVITEASGILHIYVKWVEPAPYAGTFAGKELAYTTEGHFDNAWDVNGLTVDAFGNAEGFGSGAGNAKMGVFKDYDETYGRVKLYSSDSSEYYYQGAYDATNKVLVLENATTTAEKEFGLDIYLYFMGANSVEIPLKEESLTPPTPEEPSTPVQPKAINTSVWGVDASFSYFTAALITATVDGSEINVFIHDRRVWGNVTVTNADGIVKAEDAADAERFVVRDSQGNVIIVYADGEFIPLDGLQGIYSDQSGVTIELDGAGTIIYGGVTGTYTVAQGESYTIAAFVGEGEELNYYEITLSEAGASVVRPEVQISFNLNGVNATEGQPSPITANKNVPIALPVLTDIRGIYEFAGWCTDAACQIPVVCDSDGKYAPSESIELYAKWISTFTVRVHYNNSEFSDKDYNAGDGKALTIEAPDAKTLYDGKVFIGFYTTATFEEGSEWNNGDLVTSAITDIYAKWDDPLAFMGEYSGCEVYGPNEQPTVNNNDFAITVDGFGMVSGSENGTIEDYNKSTGSFIFKSQTDYVGAADAENGVIILNWMAGTEFTNDISVLLRGKTAVTCDEANSSQWDTGLTKLLTMRYDGGDMLVFVWNNRVWGNVSISSAEDDVTAGNAYEADSFSILDSDGKVIIIYKNGAFTAGDGLSGRYNDNLGNEIVIDGAGTLTFNGNTSTYTVLTEDGKLPVVCTFVDDGSKITYYEITIDGKTATTVIPTVEITLNFMGVAAEQESPFVTNKYVPTELPNLTNSANDYIFLGWYLDENLQIPVPLEDGKYTPYNDVTLYAHWIKNLIIHVHYNNPEVHFEEYWRVAEGNVLTIDEPESNTLYDGKAFGGFYTTEDCSDGFEWVNGSEIWESYGITDIYAKWLDHVPYYGTYVGVYVSENNGRPEITSDVSPLVVDAFGYAQGFSVGANEPFDGNITGYDKTTGGFNLGNYGAMDADMGVMVLDTANGASFSGKIIVAFRGATTVSLTQGNGSMWNNGNISMFKFSVDSSDITVFIYNNRVWSNVHVSNADGEVEAGDALNTESFIVYNADGKAIAIYGNGSFSDPDGLYGTYTRAEGVDLGEITLDGAGIISIREKTVTYTVTADNTIEIVLTNYAPKSVTLEGYTIVVNTATLTYSAAETVLDKVIVTVIFEEKDLSDDEQATMEVLRNNILDLSYFVPSETNSLGSTFVGWFTDEDRTNAYVPAIVTGERIIYAGWAGPDGLYGSYTAAGGVDIGTISLNGAGTVTVNGSKSAYTVSAGNTIEVVITVYGANMVTLEGYTIAIDTAGLTYNASSKSLDKVTLTIIFAQEGLCEDVEATMEVLRNTVPDLSYFVPLGTNSLGNYFNGWFEDDARGTAYTPAELGDDKTIYAGWVAPYRVESSDGKWTEEAGAWSVSGGSESGSVYLKITFAKSGTFNLGWLCSFVDDVNTGLFVALNTDNPEFAVNDGTALQVSSGNGIYTVTVQEGDYLCICVRWNGESASEDSASISNLQFVSAE